MSCGCVRSFALREPRECRHPAVAFNAEIPGGRGERGKDFRQGFSQAADDGYRIRALIKHVVLSEPFLHKTNSQMSVPAQSKKQ